MANSMYSGFDTCDELSYGDAARRKVDELYAEADAPGTDPARARELAGRAHRLLEGMERPDAVYGRP